MIKKYTGSGSGRRLLAFPAVVPCENIAPATLLASLIDLTRNIRSYGSQHFPGNARNSRETVRHVSNLSLLLEELLGIGSGLPDSVVLSLSELHLTLQKIQYLLDDCTREGARLWMLMKSERVAGQFRVFIRAVATALDVLPLGSLHISDEVNEVVELVMKQARKARFAVDPDGIQVMKKVTEILTRFEYGVGPDRSDAKLVLDYLGIKTWNDCNKEVKFLDSEIGFEYLKAEKKREVSVLSSLMCFMNYCRCVMFSRITSQQQQETDSRSGGEVVGCLNSDDFRCPISLEIMKDPVTIETGHTYDRCSILKWFRSGNATCPKTGNRIISPELVPNLALKRLIQQYCFENGIPVLEYHIKNRDITRTVVAGSLAAEGAMKMVAGYLASRLENGAGEERNKAAYEIRILSKTSIFNRSCLEEAGVIPELLKLLRSEDSSSQENSIAALLNLSKHVKSKAVIVENRGLISIVDVLERGLKAEARQHAAAALFYLASVEEYRRLIGESTEAIPALVEIVKKGTDRGKKNALVAIYGLLMDPSNHKRVLAAKAVPLLLDLLTSSDREKLMTDSLAILAILGKKPEGAKSIACCGTLPQIVGILETSTSRAAKEHCVSLLLALCINGGTDVIAHLVKSPSLMGSLYSLLGEGTTRASKKANALIRVLHEFYERRSPGSRTPVLLQEQFIHVW